MRISRRRRKEEPKKIYFYNESIKAPTVLALDASGANLGVMNTAAAIRLAREQGMELVEINPKADPPVVKIMNFGQFRYQQEKEARLRKAHQHTIDIKGLRLSLRIGKHDLEIRKTQCFKFLNEGDKVKIEIILRGRENQLGGAAFEMIKNFVKEINATTPTRCEQEAERQGNKVTATIIKS